jgi:hypothetical protein
MATFRVETTELASEETRQELDRARATANSEESCDSKMLQGPLR